MKLRRDLLTTIYDIGFACAESYAARNDIWSDTLTDQHVDELKKQRDRLAEQLLNETDAKYFGISNGLEVFNELNEYITAELNAWAEILDNHKDIDSEVQ